MKRTLTALLALIFPVMIMAQEAGGNLSAGAALPEPFNPVHFNLQTGMNFGASGWGGNYLQSYLAPSFAMPLNKKLTISAGVNYSHTTLNNSPVINSEGAIQNYSGELNSLTMFTSGIYRVNDRLTFSGSAFKTINPAFNARLNPQSLQMEAQGVSFGIGYQVSENMHIGAEIRVQQGNSNIYNPYGSPYGNSFGNPFGSQFGNGFGNHYNSPFNNGFGGPFGY